jgi:hypothetical protein
VPRPARVPDGRKGGDPPRRSNIHGGRHGCTRLGSLGRPFSLSRLADRRAKLEHLRSTATLFADTIASRTPSHDTPSARAFRRFSPTGRRELAVSENPGRPFLFLRPVAGPKQKQFSMYPAKEFRKMAADMLRRSRRPGRSPQERQRDRALAETYKALAAGHEMMAGQRPRTRPRRARAHSNKDISPDSKA